MVLKESKSYKYISVELKGKEKVKWTETRTTGAGENQQTETIEYSEKEKCVDQSVVVWGNKEASEPSDINAGTFEFPFQFTVPSSCPPTFKTDTGEIKYRLLGEISKTGKDHKVKTPLTMSSCVDLNKQPELSQQVQKSTVKEIITCCCFSAGETDITFKMPRTGFCIVKDRIPVTVECRNGSTKTVTLRIELVQKIVYVADGHRKFDNKTIGKFTHELQASTTETKSFEFDLPSSIIVGLSGKVITVSHNVNLWVDHSWDLGGIFEEPPISVPVVIGNIILNPSSSTDDQTSSAYPPSTGESGLAYPPAQLPSTVGQSEAEV